MKTTESAPQMQHAWLLTLPKIVGFWVLYPGPAPQTRLAMYQRPTDEQIKNTEALLGWGWEEKRDE